MKELTLRDLDKLDIIEVNAEQNIKICNWINKNKAIVNIDNIFDKIIFKITNKDDYYYLIYLEFNKKELGVKVFKGHCGLKNPMHLYNVNTNFTQEDYIFFLEEKYDLCDIYLDVIYEKNFFDENILFFKNSEELNKRTKENAINFIMWYYNIISYSQLNQEQVIRQTKTHTKKTHTKKDKRKGKKPRIKLIKQNIIKLNTNHIPELTEEDITHYERHTFGWTVRGHWRTYQSGKKVWIKPQIRGDKSKVEGKIYEI
ncbi:hypothetical protein ACYIU4_002858 [Clostridium botulinum]